MKNLEKKYEMQHIGDLWSGFSELDIISMHK